MVCLWLFRKYPVFLCKDPYVTHPVEKTQVGTGLFVTETPAAETQLAPATIRDRPSARLRAFILDDNYQPGLDVLRRGLATLSLDE